MTIIAFLPFLVLVIGLVLYFIAVGLTKSSVGEIGKIMFFCGTLAFLMAAGSSMQSCSIANGAPAQHR